MPGNCGRLGGSGGGTRVREQKFKGVDKKTLKEPEKAVRPKVVAREAKKQAKKDEKAEWIVEAETCRCAEEDTWQSNDLSDDSRIEKLLKKSGFIQATGKKKTQMPRKKDRVLRLSDLRQFE